MSKTVRSVLLLPALLLAACNQDRITVTPTTTAPTQPAAGRSLGLYEMTLSGQGARTTATVARVDGGLKAQELNGLTFTPSAVTVSTDAGTGVTTYSANISVTNGSGAAIGAPTFIPVEVAGYTEAGTYFTAGKTFNSSGSATSAAGVTISQISDSTSTLLVPVSGLSASDFSLPGGTTFTSASPTAWRAPTLAAGATQNVTFGFRIPSGNPAYRFSIVFGAFNRAPAVNHLVISQVYGAGGNGGATLDSDFVELFNPTNNPISTAGMTLQYTSATGTFSACTTSNTVCHVLASKTIAPGAYYYIKQAKGTGGTQASVTPDDTGLIALGGANGKVVLASNGTAVINPTSTNVIDYVGYGSANAFEGTGPAPANTATNGAFRNGAGCTDSNNNAGDFTAGTAAPRSSTTPNTPVTAPLGCP